MKINKSTSLPELAYIVSHELIRDGVNATLSGGGAVTIYTENKYISRDLDFVSAADVERLEITMTRLGFSRKGRHFSHPSTDFTVEFPPSPVMLGSQLSKDEFFLEQNGLKLKILSPTESVMDRLAGFFSWKDRQNLQQAVMICMDQDVRLDKVKKWADDEGFGEKYQIFLAALKQAKKVN